MHLIDGGISKYYSAENALDGYHHIHLPKNENGVDVEVHFRPSSGNYDPFTNRRLQKYLNQEIERENQKKVLDTAMILDYLFRLARGEFFLIKACKFQNNNVSLQQNCNKD